MPLNDRVREIVKSFNGQKSGLSVELLSMGDCVVLENFITKNGTLIRDWGATIFTTVLASQTGGINYIGKFGYRFLVQRGQRLAIQSLEDSTSFSDSSTLNLPDTITYSEDNKCIDDRWRDSLFIANKVDFMRFNTSVDKDTAISSSYTFKRVGMDPPLNVSASKLATADFTINGGNIENTDHYYLITLYDGDTNSESPAMGAHIADNGLYELSANGTQGPVPIAIAAPGVTFKSTIAHADMAAWLTAELLNCARATHFIVYRCAAKVSGLYPTFYQVPATTGGQSGQRYINIATFLASADDFVDNTSDANLLAIQLPENNSPPPTPKRMLDAYNYAKGTSLTSITPYEGIRKIRFFRDQLFCVGASSPGFTVDQMTLGNGERVSGTIFNFSDLLHGSEVFQPDYFPYVWEIARGDGAKTIGLATLGDVALIIYKERGIYYLSGTSPDNYIIRPMHNELGCVSEHTIQETPAGIICLDRGGFVLVDRIGSAKIISSEIQDVIDSINYDQLDRFYSYYDDRYARYYCAVCTKSSTTPNRTLCYDTRSGNWSVLRGQEGLSQKIDFGSDNNYRIMIGSKSTNYLYDKSDQTVVTFNGAMVESKVMTGPIFFGDENKKKRMKWIYITANSTTDWTVDIYVIPDYDVSRQHVLRNIGSNSSYSLWYTSQVSTDGTLIWDQENWSAAPGTNTPLKIPVSCVGRVFQILIVNRSTKQIQNKFVLGSLSCEAIMMGK